MLLACGRCGKPNDFPIGGALMGFSCGEGARLAQSPELSSGSCTSVDRPRDSQVFTGDLLKFGRPGGGPGSGPGRATPERPGGEGELASFTSSFTSDTSDTVPSSAASADTTAFAIWCSSGAVADATAPSILGSSVAAADATALSFLSGSSPSMSSAAAAAAADASACGALRDAESGLSWTIFAIVLTMSLTSSSCAE